MTNRFGSRGMFCAVFFIVAGLLLLLQNLGYISGVWHFIWPSLLILWGVSIILRPHQTQSYLNSREVGLEAAIL